MVDAFIYNGEIDLLRFRLSALSHLFDHVIVVEGEETFSGHQRVQTAARDLELLLSSGKISGESYRKVVCHTYRHDGELMAWSRERGQRDFLLRSATNFGPEQVIYLSDIDEIPSPELIDFVSKQPNFGNLFIVPTYWLCYFKVNYANLLGGESEWKGPYFVSAELALQSSGEQLRQTAKRTPRASIPPNLRLGGWHWSYLGGENSIKKKLNSFSHQEEAVQSANFDYLHLSSENKGPFDGRGTFYWAHLTLSELSIPLQWRDDAFILENFGVNEELLNYRDLIKSLILRQDKRAWGKADHKSFGQNLKRALIRTLKKS